MAVIQFDKQLDTEWTKRVQPRGSRIIAYVEGVDMLDPNLLAFTAVFQNIKKPRQITMFKTVRGKDPVEHDYDTPISALKYLIERSYKKTVFLVPQEEVLTLISDSSIAQEEAEKKREISRLQEKLERIYNDIENIERWNKHEKITSKRAQLEMIGTLGDIASSCSAMITSIVGLMQHAHAEVLPIDFPPLPAWMDDAIGEEAKKHGRPWKEEALGMLGDVLKEINGRKALNVRPEAT